jgi:predicted HTH transcriptional regulator
MTAKQLQQIVVQGETTTVQFKIRTEEAYKMGVEMVAFSNTQGGVFVISTNERNI